MTSDEEADATPAPADDPLARCAHCRRPIDADEPSIVLMRAGHPVATYHESCRPDRRKSGCASC